MCVCVCVKSVQLIALHLLYTSSISVRWKSSKFYTSNIFVEQNHHLTLSCTCSEVKLWVLQKPSLNTVSVLWFFFSNCVYNSIIVYILLFVLADNLPLSYFLSWHYTIYLLTIRLGVTMTGLRLLVRLYKTRSHCTVNVELNDLINILHLIVNTLSITIISAWFLTLYFAS